MQVKFAIMRGLQIVKLHRKFKHTHGRVAQSVEQRIENPRVTGSIPVPATRIKKKLTEMWAFFVKYLSIITTFTKRLSLIDYLVCWILARYIYLYQSLLHSVTTNIVNQPTDS